MASAGETVVSVLGAMQGRTLAAAVAAVPKAPKPTLGQLPGQTAPTSILTGVATPAMFPNDAPLEVITGIIANLEHERAHLTEVIDALRLLAGDPVITSVTEKQKAQVEQKNLEREADRKAADPAPAPVKPSEAAAKKKAMLAAALVEAGNEPEVAKIMADNDPAVEPFVDRMARLQADAQAKTFTSPVIAAAVEAADSGGGPVEVLRAAMAAEAWACPIHGQAIEKKSVRRAVTYHACPVQDCTQFERL